MARLMERLTPLKVERLQEPGMHRDGGGLYLQVSLAGTKSWIFRYRPTGHVSKNGRPLSREMGLGQFPTFSLAEARTRARIQRQLFADGIDPIDARSAQRTRLRLEKAKAITFAQCSDAYNKAHRAGCRNEKHAGQWETTVATYAAPIIGALPVQSIDTGLVMKVLEQEVRDGADEPAAPLWTARPETASRLRGRIESIISWATVRGYRDGENPARWRGHLDKLLPARAKVRKVEHHAALPYGELPVFLATLRTQGGIAARALEFTILTAARTGEAMGARWGELNLSDKVWVVPGDRMKAGKEHRVPLSDRAIEILSEMMPASDAENTGEPVSQAGSISRQFVFPGNKTGLPLSGMAFLMLLRRMGRGDLTAHGFRSSFRNWAAERTSFPAEVAEMALAHVVASKVEAAYRRGDLFEKRRRLMDAWAEFCTAAPAEQGKVVSLRNA
jgi:integrase